MKRVKRFVKEWSGGLIFWLYAGCIVYVGSAVQTEQVQGMFFSSVMVFLLVSLIGCMLGTLVVGGRTLVEEIKKKKIL